MAMHYPFTDYILTTARMAVLKAKAACSCKFHPDILILCEDSEAQNRAYMIAKNTLVYHDKMFLHENVTAAVKHELSLAGIVCVHCLGNTCK